jgi:hypothetical protein
VATSVARRLAQLSARLGEIDQVIIAAAGDIVVDELTRQLERDTGGDQALSGFRGGRYRLTLDVTTLRNPAGVRIRPAARQGGMWSILDSGRSGYQVAARPRRRHQRGTKAKSSRGRAMNIDGAWRTGPWHVGATRGHHTWSKGRDAGLARAVDVVRDELHKAVAGG